MSRARRQITEQQMCAIDTAIISLQKAREDLRNAGASNAADYVARALKSAHGAKNHAWGLWRAQGMKYV